MNAAALRILLTAVLVIMPSQGAKAQDVVPLDLTTVFNWEQPNRGYRTFPTGSVTLLDIPFVFGTLDQYQWNAYYASGNNPRSIEVLPNVFGVTTVWLIANTYWGQAMPGLHLVEFRGSAGAYHVMGLVGGDDIRDFSENGGAWTSTINGATTKEAWNNGSGQRLDAQIIQLPDAFRAQRLTRITFLDFGAEQFARLFVCAITLQRSPCSPDINSDGVVDTRDFLQFLQLWVVRDPSADWNGDGVINTKDFTVFLNDWVTGC